MESSKKVATVSRRSWDVEAYQRKADERKRREGAPEEETVAVPHGDKEEFQPAAAGAAGPEGSQRAFLQARKGKVEDLDERIGTKVEVSVDDAAGGASAGDVVKKVGVGWKCTVCNCMLKDSNAYLDHINGRRHLKKLGFSMRVERSTETDLQSKLDELKRKKELDEAAKPKMEIIDYDKVIKEKDEAERIRAEERRKQRKARRREKSQPTKTEPRDDDENDEDDPAAEVDPALAAMMGFSSFG